MFDTMSSSIEESTRMINQEMSELVSSALSKIEDKDVIQEFSGPKVIKIEAEYELSFLPKLPSDEELGDKYWKELKNNWEGQKG